MPDDSGGEVPAVIHSDRSLLATDRATGLTKRLETDAEGNLYVTGVLATGLTGNAGDPIVSAVDAVNGGLSILEANPNRKLAIIYNDSTIPVFLKFGSVGTTEDFTVRLAPKGYFEMPLPIYTGEIYAAWESATGKIRVTEFS